MMLTCTVNTDPRQTLTVSDFATPGCCVRKKSFYLLMLSIVASPEKLRLLRGDWLSVNLQFILLEDFCDGFPLLL